MLWTSIFNYENSHALKVVGSNLKLKHLAVIMPKSNARPDKSKLMQRNS